MGLRWLWFVLGLVLAAPAYADGISGTYVGKAPDVTVLVQVVQTAGGRLTGRYEQTVLEPSGQLKRAIASITGASDGHIVVVSIKPTELLSGSITASGTVEGSMLHLSGGGSETKFEWTLTRTDEATYRSQVADLQDRAHRIIEGHAEADRIARLIELTDSLLTYSTTAEAQLEKFPPVEQRYRAITELMNAALARQRTIYGSGQASVARSQIGVAINQTAIETVQLHGSVHNSYQDTSNKVRALNKVTLEFTQLCRSAESKQPTELHTACLQFFAAAKKFTPTMDALERAFIQAEKVWVEESGKQEMIIRASDYASR